MGPGTATSDQAQDLVEIFRRGDVYADRWPAEVRQALHVDDPQVERVVEAISSGKSVVIAGNAGEGKSHLALMALARLNGQLSVVPARRGEAAPLLNAGSLLYIRDASQLPDDQILALARHAFEAKASLLITVNEGPLASLATRDNDGFFRGIREVVHARALGERREDPSGVRIINLAGRQVARSQFVERVLERVLDNVARCSSCGSDAVCPRTKGAELLRESAKARKRLALLPKLIAGKGQQVTARDVWVYVVDLFYGWTCPTGATDLRKLPGYWWTRAFDRRSELGSALAGEFDPVKTPHGQADAAMWLGDFEAAGLSSQYPLLAPVKFVTSDRNAALRAFRAAKRAWFFVVDLDVNSLLASQSRVSEFEHVLSGAVEHPENAVQDFIGLINQFRLSERSKRELHLSQHHVMSAKRRPAVLAASGTVRASEIDLRLPYQWEFEDSKSAGWWPREIILRWQAAPGQTLAVGYETWLELQKRRSLTVNRPQEVLDYALDLFLGQAPIRAEEDREVVVYDHRTGKGTRFEVRSGTRRAFEVLS